MKKITTIFILCLLFILGGCKSSDEEMINTMLNIELVEGKEKVSQRIDTMAHMALFMQDKNENILDKYINQRMPADTFVTIISDLATYDLEMNEETYNYLTKYALDIEGLEKTSYFEPFEILSSMYVKKELVDTKGSLGTVLRIIYDSPEEYLSMDIPYEILEVNKQDMIYVYPGQAVITIGRGRAGKAINMEDQDPQIFYLLVKTLEEIYYYEYDMVEAAGNPIEIPELEVIPKVTDKKILNQSVEKEISTYDNEKLAAISKGYTVRYSSFSKNDKQFGKKHVFFMFFGDGEYTYRISCSRQGNLDLNVYAGSGNFLYYTIPDLSKPDKIFSENTKTGELKPLELHEFANNDKETLEKIADILKIFKEFQSKGVSYFETKANGTALNIDIEPISRITDKKILNVDFFSTNRYEDATIFDNIKQPSEKYFVQYTISENKEEEAAYYLATEIGDYEYYLSCSRDGKISFSIYSYNLNDIILEIPNMEAPSEIYQNNKKLTSLSKEQKELLKQGKEAIELLKKFSKLNRKEFDFGI